MIIKCAIIDDEPLALGLLESYVKKTPSLELYGAYSSAIQAMELLTDHPVDLIFLDIQMPELNGLEFSKIVPGSTRIIFTTAFGQYALDGYKVNANGAWVDANGKEYDAPGGGQKTSGKRSGGSDGHPLSQYDRACGRHG